MIDSSAQNVMASGTHTKRPAEKNFLNIASSISMNCEKGKTAQPDEDGAVFVAFNRSAYG